MCMACGTDCCQVSQAPMPVAPGLNAAGAPNAAAREAADAAGVKLEDLCSCGLTPDACAEWPDTCTLEDRSDGDMDEDELVVVFCACEPGEYCQTCEPTFFCTDCGGGIFEKGAPGICAMGHRCNYCMHPLVNCECGMRQPYETVSVDELVGSDAVRGMYEDMAQAALDEYVVGELDRMSVQEVLRLKLVSLRQDRERVLAAMVVLQGRTTFEMAWGLDDAEEALVELLNDIDNEIAETVSDWLDT